MPADPPSKVRPPNYEANKKAAKVLAKKFIQKIKGHIQTKMDALNNWKMAKRRIEVVINEKYTFSYQMQKISVVDGKTQGKLMFIKTITTRPKVHENDAQR